MRIEKFSGVQSRSVSISLPGNTSQSSSKTVALKPTLFIFSILELDILILYQHQLE